MADRRPRTGGRTRARRNLARAGVEILREDNHVLFVAKPAGLPSQGGKGIDVHLVSLIEDYRRVAEGKPGRAYVGLVHRLDRNVSGVMVLAKTSKAARRLATAFRDRPEGMRKVYLAWVEGSPEDSDRTALVHRLSRSRSVTREDPGGREARLAYRVVGRGERHAKLEVQLETGFAHQIRAQLSLAGLPIVGDRKYGGPRSKRTALHALRLVVPHPVRDGFLDVAAPVPPDLKQLDRILRIGPSA